MEVEWLWLLTIQSSHSWKTMHGMLFQLCVHVLIFVMLAFFYCLAAFQNLPDSHRAIHSHQGNSPPPSRWSVLLLLDRKERFVFSGTGSPGMEYINEKREVCTLDQPERRAIGARLCLDWTRAERRSCLFTLKQSI